MKLLLKKIKLLWLGVVLAACGTGELRTVTTQSSDNYDIVVLSKSGAIEQGSGKFYLEFRSAKDNQPVDVGEVEVRAEMPMPGMPMVNDASVEAADKPGRYIVKYDLSMSGAWTLNVKYDKGKSAKIPLTVS